MRFQGLARGLFSYYRRGAYYGDTALLPTLALTAPKNALAGRNGAECLDLLAIYEADRENWSASEDYFREALSLVGPEDKAWHTRHAINFSGILLRKKDYSGAAEVRQGQCPWTREAPWQPGHMP